MASNNKCYLGTELKLNLSIEPIGTTHMSSYDFIVDVFCNPIKSIRIEKSKASKDNDDNYILCIDSNAIGKGKVKVKVTAYIPDKDFADGLRTEVVVVDTGISII